MTQPVICLASASPRRSALLQQIGVAHVVAAAEIDESLRHGESAGDYVLRLSREKAAAIAGQPALSHGLPVLGADTSVVIGDVVLGKPATAAESRQMLEQLSGREHRVLSAVTLQGATGSVSRLSTTSVRFRRLTDDEIDAYWRSGEPRDKAGGYAIQGLAAVFVEHLAGSYSGVMGLPLFETAGLLADLGIKTGGIHPRVDVKS
jgi:septum formation protein